MCQSYGQTEAPMLLTWLDQKTVAAAAAGDHPERLASCGRATSAVRLEIMDDDGPHIAVTIRPAKSSRAEHSLRGGYYNFRKRLRRFGNSAGITPAILAIATKTASSISSIARKDMIITGGFNVFSAEVEAGIMALAEVHECAVIGVPDETWGEAVKAIVALTRGRHVDGSRSDRALPKRN